MTTTLIHFSDPHQNGVLQGFGALFDKRLFGFINSLLKRRLQHKSAYLDLAIAEILRRKPDAVIFTGDVVSTGSPREFQRALPHYMPLVESGIPLICTAGNHDYYVKNTSCRNAALEFYRALANGRDGVFSEQPFVRQIGNLRVIALPESQPQPIWLSCGKISDECIKLVERECEKGDSPIIIAGHFPLLQTGYRRGLRNCAPIREMLKSGKIALSLCGHVHKPKDTLDAAGHGEIIAGSITRFGSMAQITYDDATGEFHHQRIQLTLR